MIVDKVSHWDLTMSNGLLGDLGVGGLGGGFLLL
jgi:hypothetical protein